MSEELLSLLLALEYIAEVTQTEFVMGTPHSVLAEVLQLHVQLKVVIVLESLLAPGAFLLVGVLSVIKGNHLVTDGADVQLVKGTCLPQGHFVSTENWQDFLVDAIEDLG
jgi:hypothetical protein